MGLICLAQNPLRPPCSIFLVLVEVFTRHGRCAQGSFSSRRVWSSHRGSCRCFYSELPPPSVIWPPFQTKLPNHGFGVDTLFPPLGARAEARAASQPSVHRRGFEGGLTARPPRSQIAALQAILHTIAPGAAFAWPGGRAREERRLGDVSADAATVSILSRLGGFFAWGRARGLVFIRVVVAGTRWYATHLFSDLIDRGLLNRSGVRAG